MTINDEITHFMQPGVSEGWLTAERGIEMADLIKTMQPETVVEIGVFGGRSLIAQALALKANGHGKIFGIDPWKKEDALEGEIKANQDWWNNNVDLHQIHKGTMEAIWRLGLDDYAVIIRAASQRLPKLFPGGIDILSIDGNHSEAASCRDVELYVPQLNVNGYCWMDDCDWATTKKAQELILKWCREVRTSADGHYKLYWRPSV